MIPPWCAESNSAMFAWTLSFRVHLRTCCVKTLCWATARTPAPPQHTHTHTHHRHRNHHDAWPSPRPEKPHSDGVKQIERGAPGTFQKRVLLLIREQTRFSRFDVLLFDFGRNLSFSNLAYNIRSKSFFNHGRCVVVKVNWMIPEVTNRTELLFHHSCDWENAIGDRQLVFLKLIWKHKELATVTFWRWSHAATSWKHGKCHPFFGGVVFQLKSRKLSAAMAVIEAYTIPYRGLIAFRCA